MKFTLSALIAEHEERWPLREWGVTKRGDHYRAFSSPHNYVAIIGAPSHELVKAEADTPAEALQRVL